jgi:hypothetical protein
MSRLMIRPWCTELLLRPILITLIPIQATCQERPWLGVRELRSVRPLGALGVATGAIAIGMVATSRSTTIIISIATTISTATSAARAATGSTMHNTAAMRLTETGKQRTSLVVRVRVVQVALVVPAVRVALVVSEDPVEPAVRVALVVPAV